MYIYTYIHTHTHTHIHTYTHTHIHTYTHTYTHTYIHTYISYIHTISYTIHTYIPYTIIHTYIHTYIPYHTYIRIHTYTYVHTYIHTISYIDTYIHTYLHTYILTYKHTYKQTYKHFYQHLYIYIYTLCTSSSGHRVWRQSNREILAWTQQSAVNQLEWYFDTLICCRKSGYASLTSSWTKNMVSKVGLGFRKMMINHWKALGTPVSDKPSWFTQMCKLAEAGTCSVSSWWNGYPVWVCQNELSITQHDAREKKKDYRSPFVRAAWMHYRGLYICINSPHMVIL